MEPLTDWREFVWYEEQHTLQDFAENYRYHLPLLALVEGGRPSDLNGASVRTHQILRFHKEILCQKRILLSDPICDKTISVPLSYPHKVHIVYRDGKEEEASSLQDVHEHLCFPDKRRRLSFERTEASASVSVGFDGTTLNDLLLDVKEDFEEQYLVANVVTRRCLEKELIVIPSHLSINIRLLQSGEGEYSKSDELLEHLNLHALDIDYSHLTINNDLVVWSPESRRDSGYIRIPGGSCSDLSDTEDETETHLSLNNNKISKEDTTHTIQTKSHRPVEKHEAPSQSLHDKKSDNRKPTAKINPLPRNAENTTAYDLVHKTSKQAPSDPDNKSQNTTENSNTSSICECDTTKSGVDVYDDGMHNNNDSDDGINDSDDYDDIVLWMKPAIPANNNGDHNVGEENIIKSEEEEEEDGYLEPHSPSREDELSESEDEDENGYAHPRPPSLEGEVTEYKGYDTLSQVPSEVHYLTVQGVTSILRLLKLKKYINIFKENQVDWELLSLMTTDMMQESFGMRFYQAEKLFSFVVEHKHKEYDE